MQRLPGKSRQNNSGEQVGKIPIMSAWVLSRLFVSCRRRALGVLAAVIALSGCSHVPVSWVGPDPLGWKFSASAQDQFAVFQSVMARPSRVSALADRLSAQAGAAVTAQAPQTLWDLVVDLSARERDGVDSRDLSTSALQGRAAGRVASTPSSASATSSAASFMVEPDLQSLLPPALHPLVLHQLQAMLKVQASLDLALQQVPADVTRQQLLLDEAGPVDARQLATLAAQVRLPELARGMQLLLYASAHTVKGLAHLAAQGRLPQGVWRLHTPQGWVHVDTTGLSTNEAPEDVWLWIKTGGDDRYRMDRFHGDSNRRAVRVLIDTGGNDQYRTETTGGDASSGVLGLSVLWDAAGDDDWQCARWCQGAALLGAAALINSAGHDKFDAQARAQAHAVGGLALLASNVMGTPHGKDRSAAASQDTNTSYTALSEAQGSAGPSGVALLVDGVGDDQYTLAPQPLVAPSSQLPDRNLSMGQGAGRGWRLMDQGQEVLATAGGVGVLIDLTGDDHYTAQVFAQGVGFHEGLGLLIDAGGHNRLDAAWYALGAAAHGAAGAFVAKGQGDDVYKVSHVSALGMGHDLSLGWFEDRGGNDRYALADMGLGVGSDGGTGVFVDAAGRDCVQTPESPGRVRGQRIWLRPGMGSGVQGGTAVFRMLDDHGACTRGR